MLIASLLRMKAAVATLDWLERSVIGLPYDSRNFSAPELITSPSITPSYSNEFAVAGGADDLVSDDVVSLTPEVYELAETLEHDYINIYNYVRQQVVEQCRSRARQADYI